MPSWRLSSLHWVTSHSFSQVVALGGSVLMCLPFTHCLVNFASSTGRWKHKQLCLSKSAVETISVFFFYFLVPCVAQLQTCRLFCQQKRWVGSESIFVVQYGCLHWPLCRKIYAWVHTDMGWIGLQHVLLFSVELNFEALLIILSITFRWGFHFQSWRIHLLA